MTTPTIILSQLDASLADHPDLHRCDRCGANGKFLVVFLSGLDLVFCAHHAHEYAGNVVGIEDVLELV